MTSWLVSSDCLEWSRWQALEEVAIRVEGLGGVRVGPEKKILGRWKGRLGWISAGTSRYSAPWLVGRLQFGPGREVRSFKYRTHNSDDPPGNRRMEVALSPRTQGVTCAPLSQFILWCFPFT